MKSRLVTLVAALATLFAGAAPATARQADPEPWAMAPCATASLSETELDEDGAWFVVFGGATQCAPVVSQGGFRIASYSADKTTGTAAGYNIRLFRSAEPGATRGFGAAVLPRASVGEYGVCVLTGDNVRTVCSLVTITKNGSNFPTVRTQALNPDAPLVAKDVVAGGYTGSVYPPVRPGGPVGVCATCF
ncbi:hypothetical protein [Jidongwangia harbinensis]|uniref:hypothetical protein n=1 Tax=Jidongwangia harbinensis TaxID=2878561 RepID=UPI001CD94D4C|nr:hypothetical protein [Jidongwangia harbinensis]MCA2214126.1 hypothetical protein [Jidongwangia harbinensis]